MGEPRARFIPTFSADEFREYIEWLESEPELYALADEASRLDPDFACWRQPHDP